MPTLKIVFKLPFKLCILDMQFKAFKLAPLLAVLLLAMVFRMPIAAVGEELRTFYDDFDGSSLDEGEWWLERGSATVSNGILTLDHGNLYTTRWFHYGRLTIKMRITDVSAIGSVAIGLQGWLHTWDRDQNTIRDWPNTGGYRFLTVDESKTPSDEETWWNPGIWDTDWHVYVIDWEPDRVRFYVDGVLRATHRNRVMPQLGRIRISSFFGDGQAVEVDYVKYEEYYGRYSRTTPSVYEIDPLTSQGLYGFDQHQWFEENKTLRNRVVTYQGVTYTAKLSYHIPEAYRNYICEVYVKGVKQTSLKFSRATRILSFNATLDGSHPLVEIRLVDPEPWMVQLYYSLLPLGIDIGVLLRWYDRLKKRHPALPCLLLIALIILLLFISWLLYRLLTGVRI